MCHDELTYTIDPDGAIRGDRFRLTPITDRVIRLEWAPDGRFEDRPSTFAIHRDLPAPDVRVSDDGEFLTIVGGTYRLLYDGREFSANGLQLQVTGGVSAYHSVWRYGQDLSLPAHREGRRRGEATRVLDGNLGGAARTLDEADGEIPLEPGVNSRVGYAVIDDSDSMIFDADGRLAPRESAPGTTDLFVFAGGHDHVASVQDLFAISGPQPLLPRFALGTWWSRYHRYSEESYLRLMDRFCEAGVPLSVAVIDMDWHLTDIDPRHGSGWTGYTWNRELFPDPERFQAALHERGLAVTLNVHPADGVRSFEDAYAAMCEALGKDPADGEPIAFDASDPAFMDAYFDVLHRRLEEQGTDFWWVDWQSGPYSRRAGLDPLWVLNIGHFEANRGSGHRPLTFSRYAGPGSHRYPVGFSGDTIISWDSLAFQPRFTAAGANIGYGWWSHDIGGHMEGYRDDELAARWVQFGVFSPIMRLHSSNSPFAGKEPWNYAVEAERTMVEHLRLRHRLLPYLHAMNRRAHVEGRSLVEPTYFVSPAAEAYAHLDQYQFGSELLVAPIVRPAARDTRLGSADVFLPEGRWTDIATGASYAGGRTVRMHRDLRSIPVLLKAGGILPLAAVDAPTWPDARMPDLEVLVAAGASGRFELWEEPVDETWTCTVIELDTDAGELRIDADGAGSDAGEELGDGEKLGDADGAGAGAGFGGDGRRISLRLLGVDEASLADLACEQGAVELLADDGDGGPVGAPGVVVRIALAAPTARIVLRSTGLGAARGADRRRLESRIESRVEARIEALLASAQIGFGLKERLMESVRRHGRAAPATWASIGSAPMGHAPILHDYEVASPELIAALTELLDAA